MSDHGYKHEHCGDCIYETMPFAEDVWADADGLRAGTKSEDLALVTATLRARVQTLEAESAGRLKALEQVSAERGAEWKRAERAEAERDAAKAAYARFDDLRNRNGRLSAALRDAEAEIARLAAEVAALRYLLHLTYPFPSDDQIDVAVERHIVAAEAASKGGT